MARAPQFSKTRVLKKLEDIRSIKDEEYKDELLVLKAQIPYRIQYLQRILEILKICLDQRDENDEAYPIWTQQVNDYYLEILSTHPE